MRIIERKDAKYLLFGILEISEKKRENHSNSEKKHFERKEASQMCLASFHIKRDTEKSISANLGIFLPRQCPCSRTTVLKNTGHFAIAFLLYSPYGERYCCAVIFAFPPSDIRLARVRCEYNIIVSFSQQYHFLRREALQRGFPGRLVPLCIPHSALRIIVPYAVNKL